MLKLIIEDDEGRKTVVPFVRDEITIGRQEGNTIRLTERNVSRRHARLMRQNGHVLIEDLGSYNGIKVNGDRITGQVQVNDGDLIQIGDYDLAIQREEELKASAGGATIPLEQAAQGRAKDATIPALPAIEPPQAADEDVQDAPDDSGKPLGEEDPRNQSTSVIRVDQISTNRSRQVVDLDAAEAPRLAVLNTDFAGRTFTIARTEIRIGRTDDNDIALDHRSLSRTHCKVVREDNGEWRVIDLQSANGIMVNGESYTQVSLRSGDVLELGHVKMRFIAPGTDEAPEPRATSITAEQDEPVASRAPIFAVVAAVLVLVVGGGGYALWKSGQPATPIKQRPPPVAGGTGSMAAGGGPAAAGGGTAAVAVVDQTAAQRAAADKLLAAAKANIEALQWDKAEVALRECTVDGSPCPEAVALLGTLHGERAYRTALDGAEQALARDELEKANIQLQAARGTVLLRNKLADLQLAYARKVEEKLKKKESPGTLEAKRLFEEAASDIKEKQYQAARNKAEDCIKADPKHAACYRALATACGHLLTTGGVVSDPEKYNQLVVKNYKLFLNYAAPDDPMVPKVKVLLKQIE